MSNESKETIDDIVKEIRGNAEHNHSLVEVSKYLTEIADRIEAAHRRFYDKYSGEMSEEKLKPCPFCGGTTEITNDEQGYYGVSCIHCDYTSERYEEYIYAIAAHNRVASAVEAIKKGVK